MKKVKVDRIAHDDLQAVVFRLEGNLTDSKESYAFLEEVRGEIQKGRPLVLMNLEKIEYLSSSGIGILAACYTSAKNAGGRMGIVAASDPARKILELVCLWDAIERFDSEEEGLQTARG